jgi:hypothetical protein
VFVEVGIFAAVRDADDEEIGDDLVVTEPPTCGGAGNPTARRADKAPDPLAILTREQAMLDAELAIATAKEALRQLAAP